MSGSKPQSLPEIARGVPNPFWDEENLLTLGAVVADHLINGELQSPWQIQCQYRMQPKNQEYEIPRVESASIYRESSIASELFVAPDWTEDDDEVKKFKLGMILRFALRGNIDFYSSRRLPKQTSSHYAVPVSHWEQLQNGGYQGRTAFAPDWIPISSWTDDILFELLRWPGCGIGEGPSSFSEIKNKIDKRLREIGASRGRASHLLFLEQQAPLPYRKKENRHRSLRIAVAQSVYPNDFVFAKIKEDGGDPTLSDSDSRRRHRRHLVTMIEGIEQMLRVRETHIDSNRSEKRFLDLLIFPELSVHPQDIRLVLLPFVRKHRCIVLAGLVFHHRDGTPESPLINSAIWLVPEYGRYMGLGLNIEPVEQGKWHLTDLEKGLVPAPVPHRPAQWVINYEWEAGRRPLRMSAAICYDSTDLALAADLKRRSDLFIVCALNSDVGTFDRMAESLHYHMYQGIVVVNNGQHGGSNLYFPFDGSYFRQVLHLHGQPQAQVAFIEADPEKVVCKGSQTICVTCEATPGKRDCPLKPSGVWKTPPAGWNPPEK